MIRIWLAVSVFVALPAFAECRLEGRKQFSEGLEALARGDLALAAAQFTALVQAQPDCAEARNNLAVVEVERGQLREAAAELRRALELRPDYDRARMNLQRVELLLAQRPEMTPPPAPTTGALETAAFPGATVGQAHAPGVPEPTATAASALPPVVAAALGFDGASAGVIDLAKREVCLYQRAAGGIAAPSCYAIANSRIEEPPQWLLTGDTGGQRLRLVDETGRRRLRIAPEPAAITGDAIWIGPADFASLAATVLPWRTIWGVVQKPMSALDPAVGTAIGEAVERWRSAWEQRQFDVYTAAYSQSFVPQTDATVAQWRARKRALFDTSGSITVRLGTPGVFAIAGGATVITLFEQHYRSGTVVADELKALRWKRDDGTWKIAAETVLRELPADAPAAR
ncbi:MAG: tetratricopeptide repeat protein [Candidatus Binatia bacterium]